jgi:hypothetical protein
MLPESPPINRSYRDPAALPDVPNIDDRLTACLQTYRETGQGNRGFFTQSRILVGNPAKTRNHPDVTNYDRKIQCDWLFDEALREVSD